MTKNSFHGSIVNPRNRCLIHNVMTSFAWKACFSSQWNWLLLSKHYKMLVLYYINNRFGAHKILVRKNSCRKLPNPLIWSSVINFFIWKRMKVESWSIFWNIEIFVIMSTWYGTSTASNHYVNLREHHAWYFYIIKSDIGFIPFLL